MSLLERNVFFVNGERNVLLSSSPALIKHGRYGQIMYCQQVLPYPSPFARIHKSELTERGGSIGENDESRWQIPSMESRSKEIDACMQ